jgi:hypothetical protein
VTPAAGYAMTAQTVHSQPEGSLPEAAVSEGGEANKP